MTKGWSTTLSPGGKWSGYMKRGKLIRFTALEDGANVSILFYNARDLTERYVMSDTLKAQFTSHLTTGHVLLSDNGRVLASFIEDSVGWHDPIAGCTTREKTDTKYGITTYQSERNEWLRSGRENLVVELARNGLGARDLVPVVNLFSKITTEQDGRLTFQKDHCLKGDTVTLRTEMDVLVVLSNTPNPLDPKPSFPSVPVKMEVLPSKPIEVDDVCVNHRPENQRAFENTWAYYSLLEN
jgi:uncharacterized protein